MLEKRLAASITATASLIVGAWEQAGKPALQIEMRAPGSAGPRRRSCTTVEDGHRRLASR